MKKSAKRIYYIVFCIVIFFISCNKKKDNLIGISISPNTMVGTPAEMFSLQQIKMFQASNAVSMYLLNELSSDTVLKNTFIAPIYLINNIMLDTSVSIWQKGFSKQYNISELPLQQWINSNNSFIETVRNIDSSIQIDNLIDFENDLNLISLTQSFTLKLMYNDSEPNGIDNIFTTIDNKKPRLDFITVSDEIRTFISEDEQVTELPVGNGNYMLMLIKPVNKTIGEYVRCFSEKKYFDLITDMQERNINVSFPFFEIEDSILTLPLPSYRYADSVCNFPKQLKLSYSFNIIRADMSEISSTTAASTGKDVLKSNDSNPIRYSSPFLFILRGKNSNLIMAMGLYLGPKDMPKTMLR